MPANDLLLLIPFLVVAVVAVAVLAVLGRRSNARGAKSDGTTVRIVRGLLPWLIVIGIIAGTVAISGLAAGHPFSQATFVLLGLAAVFGVGGIAVFVWIRSRFDAHGRRR